MIINIDSLKVDEMTILWGETQDPGILNFDGLSYIAPSAMASAYIDDDTVIEANFPDLSGIDEYGLRYGFASCDNLTSFSMPKLTDISSYGMWGAF